MLVCKQTPGKNVQLVIRPSENAALFRIFWGSTAGHGFEINGRQSNIFLKFEESKDHIQLKISWYVDYLMNIMSTEKSYAF